MASFFEGISSRPAHLSPVARFTVACGVFYLLTGVAMLAGADPLCDVVAAVEGYRITDVGLLRVAGMTVGFIGWFYVGGGRTGADSFALFTVVDRLLVPFLLVPIWWEGLAPGSLILPFAALDPLLGLVALALWRRGPAPIRG